MQHAVADRPVIVEAALNGGRTKAENPHVPKSTEELIADALACLAAGASVIHTHAPDPSADATRAAELYAEHFLPVLAARPDALLYPTIVFNSPVEDRIAHLPLLASCAGLRIGLMEPGSANLTATDEDGLPAATTRVYTNTPYDVRYMADKCREWGLGPSMVIFEPGFLRHTLAYHGRGRLPQGAFMRFTLCGGASYRGPGHVDLLFGLPNVPQSLDAYAHMLGAVPIPWAVSVVSGDVFENGVAEHALALGGHLRVGLEDYAGAKSPTNLELVERAVEVVRASGRPLASCADAAQLLALPTPAVVC
jgi:3-keto-5-aminohexanoate cleavage enzyme